MSESITEGVRTRARRKKPAQDTRPTLMVVSGVSQDTVEHLEGLLERARAGEVIGVAYVAMLKHRKYIVDTAGEADRNPTFTLGMIRVLDHALVERVRGR